MTLNSRYLFPKRDKHIQLTLNLLNVELTATAIYDV